MKASINGSKPGLHTTTQDKANLSRVPTTSPPLSDVQISCHPSQSPGFVSQDCAPPPGEPTLDSTINGGSTHGSQSSSNVEAARSPTDEKDDATYPEGGLQAWLVVVGSLAGMTASFGYMNT